MKHLMKKAVKAAVFAALTTLALTAFASAEGEMAIGAGCTTGTSLRMRSEPNTSSAIVTTLNKSVAVALLDDSVPGWYKINYNGSTGYVSSDYLIIDQDNIFTTYGRVPEGTVNVRAAATTESESLATIDAGTVVTVNGLVNGWYDVTCQYGTEGYIRSDLLVLTSNATSGKGSSIVETALSHLGTRYVYGGASAGGFDCSGFTMYIYKQFGYISAPLRHQPVAQRHGHQDLQHFRICSPATWCSSMIPAATRARPAPTPASTSATASTCTPLPPETAASSPAI